MNLFELQGKISLDGRGAINTINSVMGAAGGLAKSLGGMALDVGTAAAKTVGAATAAGAAAYGALTVQGLKAVSSLEQNLGGSQQVFKDYADEIQASAEKAFNVMGSGTSNYLQTANRMGALFQGSGFEIQESAELTTKVMQRAADVASIMGIDTAWALESVTGAAKGNFTMMDNLGVAMNATTIEAYALSKGIETSWKEMSNYQKISLAMEMFLEKTAYAAGNYAKENDTLAGSLSTAKAAVENFLDGSGGVEDLVPAIENAGEVITENLIEIMPRLSEGLSEAAVQLAPMIPELLTAAVPGVAQGAVDLIDGIVDALPDLTQALVDSAPILVEGFGEIFRSVGENLPEVASILGPPLLEGVSQALSFVGFDVDASQIEATFGEIVSGLKIAWDSAVQGGGGIFDAFGAEFDKISGTLSEKGVTIEGVFSAIGTAVDAAAPLIESGAGVIGEALNLVIDRASTEGSLLNTILDLTGATFIGAAQELSAAFDTIAATLSGTTKLLNGDVTGALEDFSAAMDLLTKDEISVKNVDFSQLQEGTKATTEDLIALDEKLRASRGLGEVDTESFTGSLDSAALSVDSFVNESQAKLDSLHIGPMTGGIVLSSENMGIFSPTSTGGVSATSAGGGAVATAVGAEYYASGGVMLHPTQFGFNPYTGNRMIGGEAGPEAIAPISTLKSYVGDAVTERDTEQTMQLAEISEKLNKLEDLTNLVSDVIGMSIKVNGREFGRLVKNQI